MPPSSTALTYEVIPYGLTQDGGRRGRRQKERYRGHPSPNIFVRGPELPLPDTYSKEMKQNENKLTLTDALFRIIRHGNQPTLGDTSAQQTEQLKGTND